MTILGMELPDTVAQPGFGIKLGRKVDSPPASSTRNRIARRQRQ